MERFEERVLNSLETIQKDITELKVGMAELPSKYVPRKEFNEVKIQATKIKQWSITTAIALAMLFIALMRIVII